MWMWVGEVGEVWRLRGSGYGSEGVIVSFYCTSHSTLRARTHTHTLKIFNSLLDSTPPGNNNIIGA